MLIENDFQQNSDEWLAWRRTKIGSSDISVLMACNPWSDISELWNDKMGLPIKERSTWATERGKAMEAVARDIYEYENKIKMPPLNFTYDPWPKAAASTDGYNVEAKYGLEIKVPGRVDVLNAKNGIVPMKYLCQVQWQMMCTESAFWDYVVLDPNDKAGQIITIRVFADKKFQREQLRRSKWFMALIEQKIPLKLRKAHCIKF